MTYCWGRISQVWRGTESTRGDECSNDWISYILHEVDHASSDPSLRHQQQMFLRPPNSRPPCGSRRRAPPSHGSISPDPCPLRVWGLVLKSPLRLTLYLGIMLGNLVSKLRLAQPRGRIVHPIAYIWNLWDCSTMNTPSVGTYELDSNIGVWHEWRHKGWYVIL